MKNYYFLFAAFLIAPPGLAAQNITTVAGTLKSACPLVPCGDGGLAIDAKLYSPAGMIVDGDDNIFIAEYSNHAVRKIDKATGIITTYAGAQRIACTTSPCGDDGAATSARLNGPRGVTVGPDGHLYISDFSNHCIRKVDKNTGIITTVVGTIRSSCPSSPCGDGGLATNARLNNPTGVGFDPDGHLYVADYGNHIIRKVDKATGIITTVAGTMKSSCSVAPCGDGGLATSALFNGPSLVKFDVAGNMYISEYGNHAVRKVDKVTGIISTYAGLVRTSCPSWPCGDGGPAAGGDARLTSPFSLNFDNHGNLHIADASGAAIRKVDKNTGIITTVAGIVKSSCGVVPCGEGGPATAAQLSNPFAVAFNSNNDMYILEYSNQALRMVQSVSSLPVTMTELKARQQHDDVQLTWKAIGETDVVRYDIEKSGSGNLYKPAGTVMARANGAQDISYSWLDNDPSAGDNFYRIKSVDKDGSGQYSTAVVLTLYNNDQRVRILPNPITNNTLGLQWTNMPAGKYELQLHNSQGQKVFSKTIVNASNNNTHSIALPAVVTPGIYSLQVWNEKAILKRAKVVVQ